MKDFEGSKISKSSRFEMKIQPDLQGVSSRVSACLSLLEYHKMVRMASFLESPDIFSGQARHTDG